MSYRRAIGVCLCSLCLVVLLHVYIISFHRLRDYEDYAAITKVALSASVSDRCKRTVEGLRCLPNVILIGASKCGTTSLVDFLSQHQNIKFVNRRIHKDDKHKEVHRFDRNTFGLANKAIELADEWASSPIVPNENTTVVHYTPHYLYAPTVPYEMKRFYPHASRLKFVVILREPLARAWSSYWFHNSHLLQEGVDKGSAQDFVQLAREEVEERRRYETCVDLQLQPFLAQVPSSLPITSNSTVLVARYLRHLASCVVSTAETLGGACLSHTASAATGSTLENLLNKASAQCFGKLLRSPALGQRHIDKGVYIDQILRWYASFSPTQFHFMTLEDFSRDPLHGMKALLRFLQVEVDPGSSGSGGEESRSEHRQGKVENGGDVGGEYAAFVDGLDFSKRRLERPNARMTSLSALPEADLAALREFYAPYNALLRSLLPLDRQIA